mgnify:CR=1 FL=1
MTSPTSESGADAGIALVTGSPETPDANRTRGAVALTRMKESKPRTRIAAGVGAVVLLAAGGLFYGSTASSAQSQYRLVAVSKGAVTESMILSATLRPVSEAAVAFPTSGTVKSVRVKPGEVVSAGQKLASLDAKELNAKVTSAKKSLADAELVLYQLENPSTGANASGTSDSATPATSARAAKKAKESNAKLAKLQRAIAETNGALTAALKAAALAAACESTDDAIEQIASPNNECEAALREALRTQREVAHLQAQQAKQLASLQMAIAQSTNAQSSGANAAPSTETPKQTTTVAAATSEQISAASAAVIAAEANVAAAEQNVNAATIVSPIGGTVLSVPFTKGDTATTSQTIVISGSAQYQASTSVSVDKIDQIAVGQQVLVTPSGRTEVLTGTVSAIGVAPESSDSSVAYPVTVNIPGDQSSLRSGSSATVEIITATVEDALAVPTSAVHAAGDFRTVNVFRDGASTPVRVSIGAVGPVETQITDGLSEGEQVILADFSEPVPSSNSTSVRSFTRSIPTR